jgi:hypothetical protein
VSNLKEAIQRKDLEGIHNYLNQGEIINLKFEEKLYLLAVELKNILNKARELINNALASKEMDDIEEASIYLDSYDLEEIEAAQQLKECYLMVDHLNKEGAVAINVMEKR